MAAFVAFLLVGACSEECVPDAALAGTWTLSSESRALFPDEPRERPIALTLDSDGSLAGTRLPGELVVEENARRERPFSAE